MPNREEYAEKLKMKIDEWNQDIASLEEKAGKFKEDSKKYYEEQITYLKGARDQLSEKLTTLRANSGDAWTELRQGIDDLIAHSKAAFEKLWKEM